jgi:hypothetical protein
MLARVILCGETDLVALRTKLLALGSGLTGSAGTNGAIGHSSRGETPPRDQQARRHSNTDGDKPPSWWKAKPGRVFVTKQYPCPYKDLLGDHNHTLGECHTNGKCATCRLFGAGCAKGFPRHKASCKHTVPDTTTGGGGAATANAAVQPPMGVSVHSSDGNRIKCNGHWFSKMSAVAAAAMTATQTPGSHGHLVDPDWATANRVAFDENNQSDGDRCFYFCRARIFFGQFMLC